MTDNTNRENNMNTPNQNEWKAIKAIFASWFNDTGDCLRFHCRLGDFARFDGREFTINVGAENDKVVWHPKISQICGQITFSITMKLIDWWHSSLQGGLAMNPRNCHGVGLCSMEVVMEYTTDEESSCMEDRFEVLYQLTSKDEKMSMDSRWRFVALNKKELCRGDFKGGHPSHRKDERGQPILSRHYAYGRRGYVTWGTSSQRSDGSITTCRGLWYSSLSVLDWWKLPYHMSDVTEAWIRKNRGDWFCRRPEPNGVEELIEDHEEVFAGLNRKMFSLWDRFEGVYTTEHPIFHSEIEKIFGLAKEQAS